MRIYKSCKVRFKSNDIYLASYLNTPYGLIANVPFIKLSSDVDPVTLGKNVLDLLNSIPDKSVNVDLAASGKQYSEHLLSLGFKTNGAFEKKSNLMSVNLEEGRIAIVPYAPGSGRGFQPVEDKKVYTSTDPEELGKQILDQKKNCG
jgi:hypothetical protein